MKRIQVNGYSEFHPLSDHQTKNSENRFSFLSWKIEFLRSSKGPHRVYVSCKPQSIQESYTRSGPKSHVDNNSNCCDVCKF